jgi:hypothetical protein
VFGETFTWESKIRSHTAVDDRGALDRPPNKELHKIIRYVAFFHTWPAIIVTPVIFAHWDRRKKTYFRRLRNREQTECTKFKTKAARIVSKGMKSSRRYSLLIVASSFVACTACSLPLVVAIAKVIRQASLRLLGLSSQDDVRNHRNETWIRIWIGISNHLRARSFKQENASAGAVSRVPRELWNKLQ